MMSCTMTLKAAHRAEIPPINGGNWFVLSATFRAPQTESHRVIGQMGPEQTAAEALSCGA